MKITDKEVHDIVIGMNSGDSSKDILFKNKVIENNKSAVDYFLGPFSHDFLNYIGTNIYKKNMELVPDRGLCSYMELFGNYFEFISSPLALDLNTGEQRPQWHKVDLWNGSKSARLKSYVSTITTRYFSKMRQKELERENNEDELQENGTYVYLWECDDVDEDIKARLQRSFMKLSERDQIVIRRLIIKEEKAIDIFDDIIPLIDTSRSKIPVSEWSNKRKQDAVSLLKIRALEHLRFHFNQTR